MPTDTFTYTGSDQTWNAPSDVDRVLLNVYGAGGGDASSSSSGGYSTAEDPGDQGARAQGELAVSGGQTLTITVGGQGGQGNNSGGWPDGGSGQKTTAQAINGDTCQTLSGGGGGASRVDDGSGDVIVAGGGGGGGGSATTSSYDTVSTYAGAGGYGGSPNGQNGEDANKYNGGAGADQGCGGSSPNGSDGVAGSGTYTSQSGGGGGGGYCGGGGGSAGEDGSSDVTGGAGGGGGSSYVGGMSSDTSMTADTRTGDGLVEITYIGQPQNVSVGSVGFRSATVSWDSVTGADEYRIYRNGTQIATVASGTTSYDDTNLSPDTSYSWTVSAVEGTLEGQESASVSATTGGAAPTGVTLDVTVEDEISVTWTDNTSNEAGFEIHYATTSGVDTTTSPEATVTTNTTSTTLTGLSDGEKYYIRVVAYDSDGDLGIDSNEVNGTTPLPAPTSLSVSNVGPDSADASWTANHDYGDQRVYLRRTGQRAGMDFVRSNQEYIRVNHDLSNLYNDTLSLTSRGVIDAYPPTGEVATLMTQSYDGDNVTFAIRLLGSGDVQIGIYDGSWHYSGKWAAPTGQEITVTGRYDGSTLSLVGDGSERASSSFNGGLPDDPSPWDIGRRWDRPGVNGSYHDGRIFDVQMHNTYLTVSEHDTIRNGGVVTNGLIGRWPLDINNNGTTPDVSEFSNDGTVNGPTLVGNTPTDKSGSLARSDTAYTLSGLLNGERYETFVQAETEHSKTRDV